MRWSFVAASLLALAIAAPVVGAQDGSGRITGAITEAAGGLPVVNANISLVGTRFGAQSGNDGRFTINGIPAGRYRIRAARIGFAPREDSVTVTDGQTASVNLALQQ